MAGKPPESVAAYYNAQKPPFRETLLDLRLRILEIVPEAQEVMKYAMPTFVVDGVAICGIMANKQHIGYYPYSGTVIGTLPALTAKYPTTKGALHLPVDKAIAKSELKLLIMARLAQVDQGGAVAKPVSKPKPKPASKPAPKKK